MNPWLSFGGGLLGLWLILFPYFNTNDLICGVLLLVLFALRRNPSVLISWCYAAIGFWLGLAPLVFWEKNPAIYFNDTIVGALVLALFVRMPAMPHAAEDTGPAIPPGFTYNPSSWPQRLPIALLAFVGWMLSRYMAAYQLGYIDTVWDPFFVNPSLPYADETLDVITSKVAKSFPIPDAGLGAFAYSLEMISAFKGSTRRWRTEPWMVILFGLLAVPLSITSVILIILQPLMVGAWCSLCLFTAFCMLIVIALSLDEVVAVCKYLRSREKPFFQLLFQGGNCSGAKEDHKTPPLTEPLWTLLKASFWGVTIRWNLVVCALSGIWFMSFPAISDLGPLLIKADHFFGALIIATSIISMADVAHKLRYINILFVALLLIPGVAAPAHWALALFVAIVTCF